MFPELEKFKNQLHREIPDDLTELDFADWLDHPITRLLMAESKEYLVNCMERLTDTPIDDQARIQETLIRGECLALRFVVAWKPDFTQPEEK